MVIAVVMALALQPAAPPTAPQPSTVVVGGDVSIEDRLGDSVPLDVRLVDHLGHALATDALFDERRPVLLVPAYFRCPMLCGLAIEGAAEAMRAIELRPGEDFRVVTVSFDARDGQADAERARARAVDLHGDELPDEAWAFLTGDEREVERFLHSVGFRWAWDAGTQQFAHGSAVFVLSPRGKLTRVLHGLSYEPLDLHMALLEAGDGKVGSFAEQLVLTCYRYDPATRRYGFWVFGFLRIAGALLLAILGTGLVLMIRHERRRAREREERA